MRKCFKMYLQLFPTHRKKTSFCLKSLIHILVHPGVNPLGEFHPGGHGISVPEKNTHQKWDNICQQNES